MKLRAVFLFSLLSLPLLTNASPSQNAPSHRGTAQQQWQAQEWNRTHAVWEGLLAAPSWSVLRPFSETEITGYVAISGKDDFELADLRLEIARNLPPDVALIVYVEDAAEVASIQQILGVHLDPSRLKFLTIPVASGGDPDWARDSLPFPVHMRSNAGAPPAFGLVASIYPQNFDPNPDIARALALPMVNTGQTFRGGNLLFDQSGNCFAEKAGEILAISDPTTFFTQYYGCATVTLLDQEGGIGDIDERIKFLVGNEALTDNANYQKALLAKGYNVHMIPLTGAPYETYMNTLFVNGTIFVPQMGIAADKDAILAYQALGFKAVGVYTKTMADQGEGNIHCVTMNYPPGTFVASLAEGPAFVQFAGASRVR